MKCVFCGAVYDEDTKICRSCEDYKGLEPIKQPVFLGAALNEVMAMIEEAREYHKRNPCNDPDCCEKECEHPNLKHADSSAHLAFCPDCELEFECEGGDCRLGEE